MAMHSAATRDPWRHDAGSIPALSSKLVSGDMSGQSCVVGDESCVMNIVLSVYLLIIHSPLTQKSHD